MLIYLTYVPIFLYSLDGNPITREVHSGLIKVANSMQHDSKTLFHLHNCNTVVSFETFV